MVYIRIIYSTSVVIVTTARASLKSVIMVLCCEYIRQQANPVPARLAPEPKQAAHQVVWIFGVILLLTLALENLEMWN